MPWEFFSMPNLREFNDFIPPPLSLSLSLFIISSQCRGAVYIQTVNVRCHTHIHTKPGRVCLFAVARERWRVWHQRVKASGVIVAIPVKCVRHWKVMMCLIGVSVCVCSPARLMYIVPSALFCTRSSTSCGCSSVGRKIKTRCRKGHGRCRCQRKTFGFCRKSCLHMHEHQGQKKENAKHLKLFFANSIPQLKYLFLFWWFLQAFRGAIKIFV